MGLLNITFILITLNLSLLGQSIEDYIRDFITKNIKRGTKYGLTVYSTNLNKPIVKINSELPLIPASTNKLFTTSIALLSLGKNYEIKTEILTDDNNIEDGTIDGNIYLKGYGDPTFTSQNLFEMCKKIKEKNISTITGDIIVDDSFFEETVFRNEWIEEENISVPLPAISSMTIDRNTIHLTVKGSTVVGKKAIIDDIENSYITIINKTKTQGRRVRISTKSIFENGKEKIIVSGTIPLRRVTDVKVFLKNPSLFAGYLFEGFLNELGIKVKGSIRIGKTKNSLTRLAVNKTPLLELIKPINKNSDNFYAEHLFLIIGANFAKGQGSAFDAARVIISYLKNIGIYEPDFSIVDGSGISRKNSASTGLLTNLLLQVYFNPNIFNDFYNSLSIPQMDGTLSERFPMLFPPNRLRGKTGTLNGVTSLAGFVTAKSGDLLIFSINFNHTYGSNNYFRSLIDKVIAIIADEL